MDVDLFHAIITVFFLLFRLRHDLEWQSSQNIIKIITKIPDLDLFYQIHVCIYFNCSFSVDIYVENYLYV